MSVSIRSEARRNFDVSPQAALNPYLRLQNLVAALKEAQPAAEDAAPHLVDFVDLSGQTLWKQMKEAFARDFQETLTKIKWPGKEVALSGRLEIEWTEGVEKLLELQEPYVKIQLLETPELSILPCKSATLIYLAHFAFQTGLQTFVFCISRRVVFLLPIRQVRGT